ncbi:MULTISPECIES: hypothetical protein [Phocaeicola]|uniref:hypothetical protein n=1 Tax=Phocaeicola TaxID=909656 RepID=UPI002030E321|nr:hypothetical protein [Phocaeicola massiliensis]MCM1613893.1 hypothetical protein [Phocaeicola massiliensis]MCM1705880.1 hypothetical protein [Phocaeicola massiliensis]
MASFSARFQVIKRPNFAPKRQGNAPDAHIAPRLRPSFGQPKGIGRPIPVELVTDKYIPNPSRTDFY